jgi:GNAT superfamily N-acetyltransferase
MNKPVYESRRDSFLISTDPARLQLEAICEFLARSYWANNRPKEVIARSIINSLCFGVYDGEEQVGFARVITDYATYAWLCDVFIHENYRGRGLGKWLMACVLAHPDLQSPKRWALATQDAHGFYRQFGFSAIQHPEKLMERVIPFPSNAPIQTSSIPDVMGQVQSRNHQE